MKKSDWVLFIAMVIAVLSMVYLIWLVGYFIWLGPDLFPS